MWGKDSCAKVSHFWDEDGYALCGRVARSPRISPERREDRRCQCCLHRALQRKATGSKLFKLRFAEDAAAILGQEAEAYQRMARYGHWGGDWWEPFAPQEPHTRKRIEREGYLIVEETD